MVSSPRNRPHRPIGRECLAIGSPCCAWPSGASFEGRAPLDVEPCRLSKPLTHPFGDRNTDGIADELPTVAPTYSFCIESWLGPVSIKSLEAFRIANIWSDDRAISWIPDRGL